MYSIVAVAAGQLPNLGIGAIARFKFGARHARNGRARRHRFQMAALPAAAQRPIRDGEHMPHLGRQPACPHQHMTVGNDAPANAGAHR